MRIRTSFFALVLFCTVFLFPQLSEAARIENGSCQLVPPHSGDFTGTNPRRQNLSDFFCNGYEGVFNLYRQVVAIDVGAFGNTESLITNTAIQTAFTISASSKESWTLEIEPRMSGAATVQNDGGHAAKTVIQNFNFSFSAPGTTFSGDNIVFGDVVTSNESDTSNSFEGGFNQSWFSRLEGEGTTNVTFDISWQVLVSSITNGISGGDEAALRLGKKTEGVERIDAGDYPGIGNRPLIYDGFLLQLRVRGEKPTEGEILIHGEAANSGNVLFEVLDEFDNSLDCATFAVFPGWFGVDTIERLFNVIELGSSEVSFLTFSDRPQVMRISTFEPMSCRVCEVPASTTCNPAGSPPQCPAANVLGTQFDIHGQAWDKGVSQKIPAFGFLGILLFIISIVVGASLTLKKI